MSNTNGWGAPERERPPETSNLRAWVGSLALTIVAALLAWVGTTITGQSTQLARFEARISVQIETLQQEVAKLQIAADNGYSETAAVRDFALRDREIDDLAARVGRLESSLKTEPRR
jgi:hypothetical protein